ncbi:hypothetical protein AAG570_011019 [Ranatra chinensis]|uniref:PABS domain-containing protein n=1 Tax=Ranatra chinensis TaxID=642074 RepID=A0ABD0YJK3_9HEMI
MSVNTVLLDFTLKSEDVLSDEQEEALCKVLSAAVPNVTKINSVVLNDGGKLLLFTAAKESFITVRSFPKGVLTINIEYFKEDKEEQFFNFQPIAKLESDIAKVLGSLKSHNLPSLKRGGIERYFPSSDERIFMYDIDSVVFEEKSPYQKVQILHSRTLGNLLILDGLQNLAEEDLIYTETLMQRGKESYEGKEIVILGGGDGALLYELLKEKPKNVLMFELDDVVIRACREHMRSCCGDVLDNLKGPNYEIIIGDCVKSLDEMIKDGRKFDYVFGDLTDVPVSCSPHGELWDFIRMIINKSFQILKPTGKYMTHGTGAASPAALRMFEEQFSNLEEKVEFSKATAFVPSFLEFWVFYQLWRKADGGL